MLKPKRHKKKKHKKIVLLARSKLNSIERKISEALMNNKISHEDFTTITNEEKTIVNLKKVLEWWKLKEVMLKKINLIEESERKGIDKNTGQNA